MHYSTEPGSVAGTNWAGNLSYSASTLIKPETVKELTEALSQADEPVKVVGSRHCFNDIADTSGTLLDLSGFLPLPQEPLTVVQDAGPRRVRVPATASYGRVAEALDKAGLALANFASLPHISIAGAISTGTHGSGDENPALVGAIWAFDLISPDGSVHRACQDGSGDVPFEAAVHLGLLGVLTTVEILVEDAFEVRQDLFTELEWATYLENFDAITSAAYSVSTFTRWNAHTVDQIWLKSRVAEPVNAALLCDQGFFGGTRAAKKLHPLPDTDPIHCTDQLGSPGPSFDRLPHFKMGFTPSKGEELQSEYLIPRRFATQAIQAVKAISEQFKHLLQVSEIRTMKGDNAWLSPSPEDSIGIHFTWLREQEAVDAVLPVIEEVLHPFEARPHWGKRHTVDAARIAQLYPNLGAFLDVAKALDPHGKLKNSYTLRTLDY